ncbi:GNAT family N-acetyltransferase [Paraconexibacter sp. AEG42_29]|uniref:GNAT family N-acetyltransferase n=1 Tax=Paraconexibacter sp. AEG42_29 TaxID=2997339 RepID=UPI00339D6C4E
MSTTEIRPATAGDAAAIDAVVDAGFASYSVWAPSGWQAPGEHASGWAALADGASPADRAWVAVTAGDHSVAGVAGVARTALRSKAIPHAPGGAVILRNLFVARAWWGTGVADALLAHALTAARDDGYGAVWLATPAGAVQARRFYERSGFTERSQHDDRPLGLRLVVYARGTHERAST